MAVDLKNEQHRKFVSNMLVMRALTPIWDDIEPEQFAKVNEALAVALEEVSRMSIENIPPYGFLAVGRDSGTPEQEASDAAKIAQIAKVLED